MLCCTGGIGNVSDHHPFLCLGKGASPALHFSLPVMAGAAFHYCSTAFEVFIQAKPTWVCKHFSWARLVCFDKMPECTSLGLITTFFLKAAICKLASKWRPIQILWTSTTKQTELGLLQAAALCGSPLFLQCMVWLLDITWRSGRPLFLFNTQRSKNLFSLLKGLHLDMVWIFN